MQAMLTGRMLSASAARGMGLIDQLVDTRGALPWAARKAVQPQNAWGRLGAGGAGGPRGGKRPSEGEGGAEVAAGPGTVDAVQMTGTGLSAAAATASLLACMYSEVLGTTR